MTAAAAALSCHAQSPTADDFNPDPPDGTPYALAVQPDGRVLVGGFFDYLGGMPRSHLARLNADGPLDDGFWPDASYSVYSFVVQPDSPELDE